MYIKETFFSLRLVGMNILNLWPLKWDQKDRWASKYYCPIHHKQVNIASRNWECHFCQVHMVEWIYTTDWNLYCHFTICDFCLCIKVRQELMFTKTLISYLRKWKFMYTYDTCLGPTLHIFLSKLEVGRVILPQC